MGGYRGRNGGEGVQGWVRGGDVVPTIQTRYGEWYMNFSHALEAQL